jgi:hypothetical protein
MSIAGKLAAISGSAHTGRALKAAKILNLLGTVRGAVTTVLLASSAIGGALTVSNVRQELKDQPAATPAPARVAAARSSPTPTATPLTAAGLRADAERRLRVGLDQDAQAVEDLRKVSILSPAATDALVAQVRQRLQARFDQAMTQVDTLLAPASSLSASPQPSGGLSVVAVNSLVQVALGDMSGIIVAATKQVTAQAVVPAPRPTAVATPSPTPVRTATLAPTLAPTPAPRTPIPTPKASPTR